MGRFCVEEGCKKQSNSNYINEKEALYCGKHRKEGMVNVKEKRICKCGKRPLHFIIKP